jgi:hypothetical protein
MPIWYTGGLTQFHMSHYYIDLRLKFLYISPASDSTRNGNGLFITERSGLDLHKELALADHKPD